MYFLGYLREEQRSAASDMKSSTAAGGHTLVHFGQICAPRVRRLLHEEFLCVKLSQHKDSLIMWREVKLRAKGSRGKAANSNEKLVCYLTVLRLIGVEEGADFPPLDVLPPKQCAFLEAVLQLSRAVDLSTVMNG